MKTSASRLTFYAQGRRRRIYRKSPHGPFYVRIQHRHKDIPHCLGTTLENVALLKAKQFVTDYIVAEDETLPPEVRDEARSRIGLSRLRNEKGEAIATLGEIEVRYRYGARTIADKEEIDQQTINGNIGALYIIAETSFRPDARSREKGTGRSKSAAVLTAELLEEFKRGWLRTVNASDPVAMSRARNTVNGYLRQARSIFSDEYLPLYHGLKLPDLAKFRAVKAFKKSAPTRYVPIAQSVIDAMEEEIQSLKAKVESRNEAGELTVEALRARALYLGFYLMLWLGMRAGEVCNARLEWIEDWPGGSRMAIVKRSYYRPKGIEGSISIAPSLLEDIRELSGARFPLDFLIPARTDTDRNNVIGDDLSLLVRRHLGPERQKTCHELRKHAVSMILMQTRSYVDTLAFSRHSDVRTLQDHYASFLAQLAPITSSNWRNGS